MEFQKELANIPDCVRLGFDVPELNPSKYIPALPAETANAHKANPTRKKWVLFGRSERTNLLENWPEIDQLLSIFPCNQVKMAHISAMPPETELDVHTDGFGILETYRPHYKLFNSTLRIHIPLVTSSNSYIFCGGKFFRMKKGECWMLNNFRQHSALNLDPERTRYHLILDVVPNKETFSLVEAGERNLGRFRPAMMRKLRAGRKIKGSNRPDFFVLGAMKCGTTSLYEYLKQHPDIVPAVKKELHYYDHKIYGEWDFGQYLEQFPDKKRHQLSFEGTVYYLRHPHAPKWILRDFPTAKLVALLRNPVNRAYSHYQQKAVKGKEQRSFEESVRGEEEFIKTDWAKTCSDESYQGQLSQAFSYLARGRYAEQLEHWFSYFPSNRFHVMFTEELALDPDKEMKKLFHFLGIPEFRKIDLGFRVKERAYDPMSREIRKWLDNYFEPHNRELENLLGRKLPW